MRPSSVARGHRYYAFSAASFTASGRPSAPPALSPSSSPWPGSMLGRARTCRPRARSARPPTSAASQAAPMSAPASRSSSRRRHRVRPVTPRDAPDPATRSCVGTGAGNGFDGDDGGGKDNGGKDHGETAQSSADKAVAMLDALRDLGMSVEETRRLVRQRSDILRFDREKNVEPTVQYLRSVLGLSDKQIKAAVKFAPQIFRHSCESEFPERVAFLEHSARIPASALPAAVAKRPHILWMDLRQAGAVVNRVVAACPLIAPDILGTVFARVPQALVTPANDVDDNLQFLAEWVMNSAAMVRVIAKIPLVLVFSKKTMDKRLRYLHDELQLSRSVVGKVVIANPDILQWSIEHKIDPAVAEIAAIVGREAVGNVITKLPAIFGMIEGIPSRIYWLREVVGLSEAEVRTVIQKAPAILTYSVSGNLNPKWTFIHKSMGAKGSDVVEAPRELFCANLQQRAMPRYAFTVSKLAGTATKVNVTSILGGSDAQFCRNIVRCDPAEYRKFVEEDRYLLFFSQLM